MCGPRGNFQGTTARCEGGGVKHHCKASRGGGGSQDISARSCLRSIGTFIVYKGLIFLEPLVCSSICLCYLRWNLRYLMEMKKRKAKRAMMARCRQVTRLK